MRTSLCTGIFGFLAVAAFDPSWVPAVEPRTNIVLILADDLGYTDVGCFGSKYYKTPHIDRMAKDGKRFTSGYTCGPNCQPTRAALMSGQYGPRTGVYTVGGIERFDWQSRPLRPVDNVTQLPLEKRTLAVPSTSSYCHRRTVLARLRPPRIRQEHHRAHESL